MLKQLIEFVAVNWMLVLALVVILALIVRSYIGPGSRAGLRPMDAVRLVNHENAVVVDVRTDQEFQAGHILNAIHIPLGAFEARMNELDKYKGRPIVMSCQSGNRSGRAIAILKKRGFDKIYNLTGGIMAWQNASLPLTKKISKPES